MHRRFKGAQATRRLQALGRLKSGEMNKTETAYSQLLQSRQHAGEILWYAFEGIKLRLADKTFLTVDFAVMDADGYLQMVDVKGAAHLFSDDAKVKMKVAAERFPFAFKIVYPRPKRDGGGWEEQII
ncbi:DUF1064 domain-containing protein [Allopusillimonas soli]|uniref:DUF1064 domain-containing protein n=1 Tax=Allopusillimonas soli TaxID=659016 RepID=A0A853FGQ1_9BURK|nr:DUF1064 domain-containing protein [Allopusillimonas soli]NYT38888.1 DUF1064 domain-containing protein [Allopusillimonas soli]TEA70113.1 DUF1064 domain-containing protein [Allopusillimonas soli]